jgi:hypothetical protein
MAVAGLKSSGVAVVLLLAAAVDGAEKPVAAPAQPATAAAPTAAEGLTMGDEYTVDVRRGDVKKSCGGKLVNANDKWLVLRSEVVRAEVTGVPLLMDLPVVGRLFRRQHDNRQVNDLWIPREAAMVTAHVPAVKPKAMTTVPGNEPPTPAICNAHFVMEGKLAGYVGTLSAVSADGVTLSDINNEHPQQLAQRDILCLETSQAYQQLTAGRASGAKRK